MGNPEHTPGLTADGRTIHDVISDECGLAAIYAEDGGFHSAHAVLLRLAAEVKAHAERCDAWIAEAMRQEAGASK